MELCGFRTEHCPPGVKTGDAISPPGGYVGGGLQLQVDVGIGPAGDVWVTNNWQDYKDALGKVDEAVQTLGAGQGRGGLLRNGKAGKGAADRSSSSVLGRAGRKVR